MTDRKQELRRQFRVVRRNPHLIAALFLHQTGLQQTENDLDFAALRQLHREQARLRGKHLAAQAKPVILTLSKAKGKDLQFAMVNYNSSRERPKEGNPTTRAEGASARTAGPATKPVILTLSKAKEKDLQFAMVSHNSGRERPKEAKPNNTRHRRMCPDGQSRPKEANPTAHIADASTWTVSPDQRKRTQQHTSQMRLPGR